MLARWAGGEVARYLGDRDTDAFNLHFGRDRPTRRSLKRAIRAKDYPAADRLYSPAYVGSGLRLGRGFSNDAGWGRWDYILKKGLPEWRGMRVLDLGANNGCYGLQMLREGAKEIVGVESDPDFADQGEFLKSCCEWADGRRYAFSYVRGDLADLPVMDLGRFDFVMALCSLYYTSDAGIADIVEHVSTISDCFVLQCNHSRYESRTSEDTYRKATAGYAISALRGNGFPVISVVWPQHYPRPLVIGRRRSVRGGCCGPE